MQAKQAKLKGRALIMGALALTWVMAGTAFGHCDTMDGPVVKDAQVALEKGDVTQVLKWVPKETEGDIRQAFQKTLVVRAKGTEAKELADRYFFETLVRLHRASEGAPYTGVKPAGTPMPAAVAKSDEALERGNVDDLAKRITAAVEGGIRKRFATASEARKHQGDSVDAGRKFVAAYVEFVHYVERIHDTALGHGAQHGHEAAATPERLPQEKPAEVAPHHEH